ncbi:MAG: TIGR03936 family radical SAM-associated protein [Lachnospiraceae bacterium]|nr:TIGR03936 family radical SAM-associated protein [Lachnospiraceae bacterium]
MKKLRIKFAKYGAMKFIGHLDMMRFFQKAVRRAGINIAYSGGFSPHQIMSFASPLGVGLTSKGEYLDISINTEEPDIEEIFAKLSEQMVEGIEIIAVSELSENAANAMASVAAAGYTVIFNEKKLSLGSENIDWVGQFKSFLQSKTIIYTKCTKKVTREIYLRPLIYEAVVNAENKGIYLLIDASSANSIKPQFVIEAFFDYIGQHLPDFSLDICREEVYANAGTAEDVCFVPLGS